MLFAANKLELSLSLCDLAALVRETVEDQQATLPTSILNLELPDVDVVLVTADARRIEQAVSNYSE
jgi:signal transduction histidine kinase